MQASTATLVVAAALTLGACGSPDRIDNGPLGGTDSPGVECFDRTPPDGAIITVGIEILANRGDTAIVIEGLKLVEPRGLIVTDAQLLPLDNPEVGYQLAGFGMPFPPTPPAGNLPLELWRRRLPVQQARIGAGKQFNLVLGVPSGTSSTFRPAIISWPVIVT
jgi:hypothetical protein